MRTTSKIKRIFAGLLALLLTVALLPAQTARIAKADPTTSTSTFEPTQTTGSLKIHKYEYNRPVGEVPTQGTGESTDSVPGGATELNGVTFRVTYVDTLNDYYKEDGKELPTVDNLTNESTGTYKESYYSTEANKITVTSDFAVGKWMEIETVTVGGKDGIAQLTNLPLGIYLVHEVSAPAQITGKAADFLVSIPMTRQGSATALTEWLYDVEVFPKNSSTYGSATLQKWGKTGTSGTEMKLSDSYFVLEKYNDATSSWERVAKDNKNVDIGTTISINGTNENNVLATNSEGKITVSDLAPGHYCFRELAVKDNTGYIADTLKRYEFEIKADGQTYLYNSGTLAGSPTDTSSTPIKAINYKPDAEKDVKDRNDNWDNDADYSIGDKIPYRIKIDVPENVASLRSFKIEDTLTNQTVDDPLSSFKIYEEDSLTTDITSSVGKTPTVGSNKKSWEIEFNTFTSGGTSGTATNTDSALKDYAGESIYIYFEAKLADDAVTTTVGNPNDIDLSYSNTVVPDNGTEPPKDIIHDEAIVYTFELDITKQGENDTVKLAGVKFDLYRQDVSGTIDNTMIKGLPDGAKFVKVNDDGNAGTDDSLETDDTGKIVINAKWLKGLENGTYYLVETKTADGYNLLKEPLKIEITVTYNTTTTGPTISTDGFTHVTTTTTEITATAFTESSGTPNDGKYEVTIKNSKGFTLPTTGGVGSVIFVFVGVSMMIAAVIMFYEAMKKKGNKKENK